MPLWVKGTASAAGGGFDDLGERSRRPISVVVPGAGAKQARPARLAGSRRIVNKELVPFTRQVSSMLSSGMTLVSALTTLHDQAATPAFRTVVGDLLRTIEGGAPFSDALLHYPTIFDPLYVNMMRAGERSGEFAPTMQRLALMMEASAKLKRKVKSAMTYPTVVFSMALVISVIIITCVVPVFGSMYGDFGSALPLPTQILVTTSAFLRHNLLYVAALLVAGVILFRRWAKSSTGQLLVHAQLLKMPVAGPLIQKVAVARFTRLMAQMLRSGVPILEALELVGRATGNRVIENAILDARRSVEQGGTITSGLENKRCLPTVMIRMVGAGEKSGRLDEMLDNIADTYDDEVETMLSSLTSLMEPILMVFLGVVIGGIVIALFMPIFKMGEIVSKG